MANSPQRDPDDCFHCPQGDKPCPVTYQPGAWLTQPPVDPTPAVQDRPSLPATSRPPSSRPSANFMRPWQATPGDLAGLPADMQRASVAGGAAGRRRYHPEVAGSPAASLPTEPRRGSLRPGRAARQRECRRHRARHQLAAAAQSLHPPRARRAGPLLRHRPPAGHHRRSPAQRPAGHPDPGPEVRGSQPRCPPSRRAITGRTVPVGPPRGAGRYPGCQRGRRAVQRKPRPPAHHPAWAIIRRAERSHRLADQRQSRADRHHIDRAGRADRTSRP